MTKFIDIKFDDEELNECVDAFNYMCSEKRMYPNILSYDHYTLFLNHNTIGPTIWKKFLSNEQIIEWYEQETNIAIRTKTNKLINNLDNGTQSTGTAQTLSQLLSQLNKTKTNNNKTIIIYTFIPLTKQEEENPNINVSDTIPNSIANAIQTIDRTIKNDK